MGELSIRRRRGIHALLNAATEAARSPEDAAALRLWCAVALQAVEDLWATETTWQAEYWRSTARAWLGDRRGAFARLCDRLGLDWELAQERLRARPTAIEGDPTSDVERAKRWIWHQHGPWTRVQLMRALGTTRDHANYLVRRFRDERLIESAGERGLWRAAGRR